MISCLMRKRVKLIIQDLVQKIVFIPLYKNLEECKKALHFPNPNEDRKISLGPVMQSDGCIRESLKDSHVDFWIYENHSEFWRQYKII